MRNRRHYLLQYRVNGTKLYVSQKFNYALLAKEFYDELADKEKQSCDIFVKQVDKLGNPSFTIINYDMLCKLIGSGNKSPKILKGKRQ